MIDFARYFTFLFYFLMSEDVPDDGLDSKKVPQAVGITEQTIKDDLIEMQFYSMED
jgi:hypothetical protein